jgi:prephenate dehydrogenase
MPELAEEIRPSLDPDCLVTDVASTKRRIAACLGGVLGGQYVPAHPMAGSELAGIEAARADLFEDALCLLTPDGEVPEAFVARAEHLWRSVGCRTRRIGAAEHDRLVARVSHLPHAVASALVSTVAASAPEAFPVAAGGFRDTTRVAGGPAAMWAEIFLDNREEVLAALAEFGRSLGALGDLLRHGDREGIEAMLEGARAERERLP